MELLYLFVGWLLGLFCTLTVHWYERNQKRNDFVNGLYTQLLEVHPRVVLNHMSMQTHIEPLKYDTVQWIDAMLPSEHAFVCEKALLGTKMLLSLPPGKAFDEAAKTKFEKSNVLTMGKGVKRIDFPFLQDNLDQIPLVKRELQAAIWRVVDRISLFNQEHEAYWFFYKGTFDPEVMDTNKEALTANMETNLRVMANEAFKIAGTTLDLLERLKAYEGRWTYERFYSRHSGMLKTFWPKLKRNLSDNLKALKARWAHNLLYSKCNKKLKKLYSNLKNTPN